jgi:hypothetical protein
MFYAQLYSLSPLWSYNAPKAEKVGAEEKIKKNAANRPSSLSASKRTPYHEVLGV